VLVNAGFFIIHKGIYKKLFQNKFIAYEITFLTFIVIIGLYVVVLFVSPKSFDVPILDIVVIVAVLLSFVVAWLLLFNEERQKRRYWYSLFAFYVVEGVTGIVIRLPFAREWAESETSVLFISSFFTIACLAFVIVSHLSLKNEKLKK
jgi:hypothetical protein